jgi:hypothetical protein
MTTIPKVVILDANDGIDSFASEADTFRAGKPEPVHQALSQAPMHVSARPLPPAVPIARRRFASLIGLMAYAVAGILLAIFVVQPLTTWMMSRSTVPDVTVPLDAPVLPSGRVATVARMPMLAPTISDRAISVVDDASTQSVDAPDLPSAVFQSGPVTPSAPPPLPVRVAETQPSPPRVTLPPPASQTLGARPTSEPNRDAVASPRAETPRVESPRVEPPRVEPARERAEAVVTPAAPPVATPPPAAAAPNPTPAPTPAPTPTRPPAAAAAAPPASPPAAGRADAPASAPAAANIERDVTGVQTALTQYRNAFSALDAAAVARVWPTVNQRNLSRAFDRLDEQEVAFDGCEISVNAARAEATCRGMTRYVPRVGSRAMREDRREWKFSLVKARDEWQIGAVEVR